VVNEDAVQLFAHPEISRAWMSMSVRLALHAAERLVDHDPRVRQRRTACPGRRRQQQLAHGGRLPMQIVEIAGFTYCIVS